jgi:hypothetical protein
VSELEISIAVRSRTAVGTAVFCRCADQGIERPAGGGRKHQLLVARHSSQTRPFSARVASFS